MQQWPCRQLPVWEAVCAPRPGQPQWLSPGQFWVELACFNPCERQSTWLGLFWVFLLYKRIKFVLGKRETFTKKPPCPCQDEQANSQWPNTINTDASIMMKLSFSLSPCPCLPVSQAHHKFWHLQQGCNFIHKKLKIYSLQDKTPKNTRLWNTDVYSDWNTQWPRQPLHELSFLIKQNALPCHVN